MKSLFTFNNYKLYLKYRVSDEFRERGLITKMAEAAGCQRSYLSQVLTKEVELTPDHAFGLTLFWNFNEFETQYFLLLVNLNRSATLSLKTRIKKEMSNIIQKQEDLKERIKQPAIETLEMQQTYYSEWHWMAIHVLVSIPEFQHEDQIAKHLSISKEKTLTYLKTLREFKLVKYSDGKWSYAGGDIHLNKTSPLNSINHNNWRQQAVQNSQIKNNSSIHFTSISSISANDYLEMKQLLLAYIDKSREIISPSKEEKVICFNCDLFTI